MHYDVRAKYVLAKKILKEKSVLGLTGDELDLVHYVAADACFEAECDEERALINQRDFAIGKWAFESSGDESVGFVNRSKIEKKYEKEIDCYLENKVPKPRSSDFKKYRAFLEKVLIIKYLF